MADFIERLKAALAGRYEIERELGAGGMAIVFLADDTKHERKVAIKVMRPELAAAVGGERFLREIKTAAKISHPNVLPVFDSGEADGFLYYVMPFVEGESLADLMVREQQLSIDDAVRITREIAEALSVAHSHGLVHRDIKPQNIMLSGGHAIVADFGIARAVDEAGAEKLTETGMAVGTPAYMSPEQARGSTNVDGRADIYSLGCVLFEMLVGQVPFTGPTPMAVIARHTMDHVTPPSIMRDTIPQELEDIVLCAMAKTPADRFRTAHELAEALAAVEAGVAPRVRRSTMQAAHGTGTIPRPTQARVGLFAAVGVLVVAAVAVIGWQMLGGNGAAVVGANGLDPRNVAVLYLEDRSANGEMAYIADGLTESLIQRLSEVRALDVVSRNGVTPYRNSNVDRDSIARALKVGSLVIGSVEPEGNRIRVNLRLIDGETGTETGRESFALPEQELLVARDSVAEVASWMLRTRLGEEVRLRRQTGTTVVDAWALAQRGERLRKDAESLADHDELGAAFAKFAEADSALAAAESIDDNWIDPIVLRGEIAYRRGQLTYFSDTEDNPRPRFGWIQGGVAHADRAFEINTASAAARELRGTLRYWHWLMDIEPDLSVQAALLDSAEADLREAVRLDPSRASAHYLISHLSYQRDDNTAAVLAARRAYEEDAYLRQADRILNQLFLSNYDIAEFTNAQTWCNEGVRRFPDDDRFVRCQLMLSIVPSPTVSIDSAWQLSAKLETIVPDADREYNRRFGQIFVGGALARAGLADSARSVLDRAHADREIDPRLELLGREAAMRVILGDRDDAIQLLKTYVASNPGHSFEIQGQLHWWWRDLRSHPDFSSIAASH